MPKRQFILKLPDKIIRQMNRKQYKGAMSFLRRASRMIESKIDYDELQRKICNSFVTGKLVFIVYK